MEIHAAPKLSRYTTALGAYTIKSFTSDINQRTHAHTNKQKPHIHTHTHPRTHASTRARSKKFVLKKIRQRNKSRKLKTLLKEMGFQTCLNDV